MAQDDSSDEGWQEAVPKGRSLTGRKTATSRRPTLAKLNTNFMNVSQSSKYRGKPANFSSPRTNINETSSIGPSSPVSKKFLKSASFSPKLNSPNSQGVGADKSGDSNSKSAPASPADNIAKAAAPSSSISVKSAGKLLSYKEVALAPPGTIVKAVAEHSPKGSPIQQSPDVSHEIVATKETDSDVPSTMVAEEDYGQKPIDDNQQSSVHEHKEKQLVIDKVKGNDVKHEVVEVEPQEQRVANDDLVDKKVEEVNITATEVENSVSFWNISNNAYEGASVIEVIECCQSTSSDPNPLPRLIEDSKHLFDKDDCVSKENVEGDEKQQELHGDNDVVKSLPPEGEKQDALETGKEPTKKLSAAAPPFNPSTIPVFGSVPVPVPVPGFKDHGGILPPPVNIPPMLAVNPRRSAHQSATARVPYGPRISGGYNRYGNRVPRNKTVFHSGEHTTDGNPNSPPRIMNPHATEFVPGQPWVQNCYTVSANGYLAPPNGIPVSPNSFTPMSPNGISVSPSGFPASLNAIPVSENGLATSPTSSTDSAQVLNVETNAENKDQVDNEEIKDASAEVIICEKQQAEHNPGDVSASDENCCPRMEEKPADLGLTAACSEEDKITTSKETLDEEKQGKCWGDYSDGEVDMIEVTS
ncbi:hypothetical protein PIB30_068689 [Stylosanthes scabra]|uniref:Uncharacterized protein n=1 Tax=Stylosanthes scabra TaxID=79078 RepID=A0ABU6ZLM6_9FABA|nr:hypothetical protein [Stylosanthes scabra]